MDNLQVNNPVFFMINPDNSWLIEFVSNNISQFGYNADEIMKADTNYLDLVHPGDHQQLLSEYDLYKEKKESMNYVQEYRMLSSKGLNRWVNVLNMISFDTNGNLKYFHSLVYDNTYKIATEKGFEDLNRYFEAIVNTFSEALVVLDQEMIVIYANNAFFELFKLESDDVIGTSLLEIEKKPLEGSILQSLLNDIYEKELSVEDKEIKYDLGNSTFMDLKINARCICGDMADGKLILMTMEDITEIKEVESLISSSDLKYSTLIEKGTEGMVIIQEDLIKFSNSIFSELAGIPKDMIPGTSLLDYISIEYRRMFSKKYHKWLSGKETLPLKFELELISATKDPIPIELRLSNVEYGGQLSVMCNVHDISEKKKTEVALQDTEKNFRTIFEKSPIGIVRFDQKGMITNVNENFCELVGKTKSDFIGSLVLEHVDDKGIKKGINEILAGHSRSVEGEIVVGLSESPVILQITFSSLIVEGFLQGGVGIFEDITLRKKAENALNINKERLECLLELNQMGDNSPDEVLDFGLQAALRITQSQKGYIAIIGDAGKVIKKRFISLEGGENYSLSADEDSYCSNINELIEDAMVKASYGSYVLVNELNRDFAQIDMDEGHVRGGTLISHLDIPLIGDEDEVVLIVGVGNKELFYDETDVRNLTLLAHDIWNLIEHKKADEALRVSEQKYSTLVEKGNDGIIIIQDTTLKFANSHFCEIIESNLNDILGVPIDNIISMEYRRMVSKKVQKLLQSKKDNALKFELQLLDSHENEVPVEMSATYIENEGNPAVMAIVRDITEQKEKEQALLDSFEVQKVLQEVIKNSPAIVFFWGAGGEWPVEFVSDNIERFGYSPEDFISGRLDYGDVIHPSDIERVHRYFSKRYEDGSPEYRVEYRIITSSGDVRWVVERSAPKYDDGGRLSHIQGIIMDITERKRINQFLNIESEVGNFFTPTGDLQETFDQLLDFALHIETIDAGALYLIDNHSGDLNLISYSNLSEDFIENNSFFNSNSMQARYFLMGYPIYKLYSEIFPSTRGLNRIDEGLLITALLPIYYKEEIVAVLFLASHNEYEIPFNVRSSLETIAAQIGSVIGRIETEVDLAKNQSDLKVLIDSIDDFIFVIDTEGCIIYNNESVLEKFGYSTEEITGMNFLKMHPHNKVLDAAKVISDALDGNNGLYSLPLVAKSGMQIFVQTRLTQGYWNEQPVLIAVCREIDPRMT